MKDKLTIAVCGLMDSGKSTLIKTTMKALSGRTVEPDALCLERETGKTITGTRIACPVDESLDVVMVDCPGHMEYLPEIISGLCAADAYIMVIDEERPTKSKMYAEQLSHIAGAIGCPALCTIHSHSDMDQEWHYDIETPSFAAVLKKILHEIDTLAHDLTQTPPRAVKGTSSSGKCNACLASIVWLDNEKGNRKYIQMFHGCEEAYNIPEGIERDGKTITRFLLLKKPAHIDLPSGTRVLICENTPERQIVGVGKVLNP